MPLALLGICLLTIVTSAGDKAIAFTPGEVDFLFAALHAPSADWIQAGQERSGALLTGLFLSVVLLHHARWWPACYVGIVLSLLFVQLFSINAVILGQTAGANVYSNVRRLAFLIVIVVAVAAMRELSSSAHPRDVLDAINHFHDSPVGSAILSPFDVFGQALTARNFVGLAQYGVLAAIIDALLLMLVFTLDASYAEAAMTAGASTLRADPANSIRLISLHWRGEDADVSSPARPGLGEPGRSRGVRPSASHGAAADCSFCY